MERNDDITFIDGPGGSATITGRVTEHASVHHGGGFHIPERLLRPRYAPIWGRTGEDWRLADELEDARDGLARVVLQGMGGRSGERGSITVDTRLGRLHSVSTPAFTWTVLRVGDESFPEVERMFALPTA